MRKAVAAAVTALMSVSAAQAADLGGSMKDIPMPEVVASTWGGLYIGGTVGFGVGQTSEEYINDYLPWTPDSFDVNGGIFGLHIGYNFQRGPLVFGVEAAWNGSNIEGNFTGDAGSWYVAREQDEDWYHRTYAYQRKLGSYGTVTGRIGYAPGNIMPYAFAGVAWGRVKTNYTSFTEVDPFDDVPFSITYTDHDSANHTGWTAGLGLEVALNDRIRARVEYGHLDFGSETLFTDGSYHEEADLTVDVIKVGASIKVWDRERAIEVPMK